MLRFFSHFPKVKGGASAASLRLVAKEMVTTSPLVVVPMACWDLPTMRFGVEKSFGTLLQQASLRLAAGWVWE
jgi:hypothetical protein